MTEQNAINKQSEDLLVNKASGDPFVNFQINSVDKYVIGVDDSDSDALKINLAGASPSAGTNAWKMSAAGERIMPVQPAFYANTNGGAAQNNVTGNATNYTVQYTNERFDQNADYDGTSTFTAPVTGRYAFMGTIQCGNITTANRSMAQIVTSNSTYICEFLNPNPVKEASNLYNNFASAIICDMDATDTCVFKIYYNGQGADTINLNIVAYASYFCGKLVC